MLHRDEDFEEWELAGAAMEYIPLYLKKPDDRICFVEYLDVPSGTIKYIKYIFEPAIGWVYVDNSQFSE